MKFSNYQEKESGFSLKGHSKCLNWILKKYAIKIAKKHIKKFNINKKTTKIKTNVKVVFDIDYVDIGDNL